MEFKTYRKIVPTKARVLTEGDYNKRQGVVQTLEGPVSFELGDYLAHDAKGEWPIKQTAIQQQYRQVTPEDEHGFAGYLRQSTVVAAQMPESFTIDGLTGQTGDYLVLYGGREGRPVNREIFEQTYALASEE